MKSLNEYVTLVNACLEKLYLSDGSEKYKIASVPERLKESMRYSLMVGGKRLRPAMMLAAVDMLGGDVNAALPYACSVEMIHTYSLIHDDLPGMDNDTLRRGKPTNHVMFGVGQAILAGDGLLNVPLAEVVSLFAREVP